MPEAPRPRDHGIPKHQALSDRKKKKLFRFWFQKSLYGISISHSDQSSNKNSTLVGLPEYQPQGLLRIRDQFAPSFQNFRNFPKFSGLLRTSFHPCANSIQAQAKRTFKLISPAGPASQA